MEMFEDWKKLEKKTLLYLKWQTRIFGKIENYPEEENEWIPENEFDSNEILMNICWSFGKQKMINPKTEEGYCEDKPFNYTNSFLRSFSRSARPSHSRLIFTILDRQNKRSKIYGRSEKRLYKYAVHKIDCLADRPNVRPLKVCPANGDTVWFLKILAGQVSA
ncbi:hypothetical protein BpHYR1_009968 [Brachionus plicatilis]|uniref:Uncharacterized protein n=1 Tax=Brachionus plicatilis TaxID=10195 RepID=A0A3M7PVS6_BRAPC|nr:hypothetical protein BpHYR1_009968 [Brachionus plicatilis]